ncbi:MAG: DMT family transporter [Planktomarina sp.]
MQPQKTMTPRAWAELGLLSLIWGGSFLSIRIALDELPFLTSVLFRTAPAAVLLWVYVLWRGLDLPRAPKTWAVFAVMGLLNNVIPFSLMAWGQLHIESGLTSILNASTAILGVLVAAVFLADERLTLRKFIGVTVGFVGVATAIGLKNLTSFDLRSLAQWAVLLGTLSYAFAGAWGRLYLQGLKPEVAAAGMLTASTVFMFPLVFIFDGIPCFDLDLRTWGAVGYYSIIATAIAYLLYYRILSMAGSGNLMLVTLLVSPIAIILGALVLNEILHPQAFLGFAILGMGLLILNKTLFPRLLK